MPLPRFLSRRERNLWLFAAGYTLLIYSTLAVVRTLTTYLRQRGLVRPTLWTLSAGAVIAVLVWVVRGRPKAREWAVLGLVAVGYLAVLPLAKVPEEKFHLLEYGLLGGVIYAAVRERARHAVLGRAAPEAEPPGVAPALPAHLRHAPATAFLLTAALGLVDEMLQGVLPSRFYDTRDVLLNALAGGLAIAAMWGRERARAPRSPSAPAE